MLTYVVGSQLAPLHTGQGKPEESAAEHIARKIKDTSSVHTVILPDWIFKKWGLSSFAFQSF